MCSVSRRYAIMAGRYMSVLTIAATVVGLSGSSTSHVELIGPNVCTTVQVLTEKTTVVEYKIDTQITSYFCIKNWNFKCYVKTDHATPVNRERLLEESRKLRKCCDGYQPTPDGTHCRPVCSFPCIWGECVLPDVCKCNAYYEGKYCNISKFKRTCPTGKYGINCTENCLCQNGECDQLEGNCYCAPGFIGRYCNTICPPGLYGHNCRQKCHCQNNETCNPFNGTCYTSSNDASTHIDLPVKPFCMSGFYGNDCQGVCQCKNGGICDQFNGSCFCQPGFTGIFCELMCPVGYYGYRCQSKCKCENNAVCDPVNGMCMCQPGFFGQYCSYPCPTGFFGYRCFYRCNCENGTVCNPVNGLCECLESNTDENNCIQKVVMNNSTTYLENPEKNCNCNWYKAYSCDPLTGKCKCKHTLGDECHCKPGYTGYDCRTVCPRNTYGINCKFTCRCYNGAFCRPTDGVCLCKSGFYGPLCRKDCPHNYYGEMCLNRCNCNTSIEYCDSKHGCISNVNKSNTGGSTAIQLKINDEQNIWIFKISFILDVLIMSVIILLILCLVLPSYYFFLNRHPVEVLTEKPVDISKKNTPFQYQNPIICAEQNAASISVISKHMRNTQPWDLQRQPMSYMNHVFYAEYGHHKQFDSYNTNGENLYLEIDECVLQRAPLEDSYDRLDFLRPTGSWKPHYQSTLSQQNSTKSNSSNNRPSPGRNQ